MSVVLAERLNAVHPEPVEGCEAVRPEPVEGREAVRPELVEGREAVRPEPVEGREAVHPELVEGCEAVHPELVEGAAAWRGDALVPNEWVVRLEPTHLAELDEAIRAVAYLSTHEAAAATPRLPTLSPLLKKVAADVDEGRGFCLLRGFDASRYSEMELRAALTVIGAHFGTPVSQNMYGDSICSVRQTGRKLGEPGVRGYDTDSELRFHNDECDIIGLLCVQPAKSGGQSSMVSSAAIYETMRAECPDKLAVLERGYVFSLMGEERPGVAPVSDHRIPVFSVHQGRVSCRYTLNTIYQANRSTGVPLTAEEQAALDAVLEIGRRPGMHVRFQLEAGDMQFCNNLSTLHARTSFEDHEEPQRWRHLLRIWLRSHHPRPLAPEFEERFNGGWSFRRGIPVSRPRT